jgi:hypothetical protein
MVELICNLAWLTTGAVLAWQVAVVRQERSRVAVRLIAVVCLMLVLFPVISLSDDLSTPEAALIDAAHSIDQSASNNTVDHASSVAVALATSAAAIRLQFLHFAEPAQQHDRYADANFLSSDALRGPPAVL